MNASEKLFQLALYFTPGVGPVLAKHLISQLGSAQAVFSAKKERLSKINGIGAKTAEALLDKSIFKQAEEELKKCEKSAVEILFFTDENYPQQLKEIADSPIILFKKGNLNINHPEKIVSIVGTRNATDYGKQMTEELVKEFANKNALIVSGLAYGIDICAHKSALKNGIPTVAVMASGIDIIYPSQHKQIAADMMQSGAVITEELMGTKPDAHRFPSRNRIIAGMSLCTIVIEASEKGGALITAEIANSYNKEIFAIPGNVNNEFSKGTNKLIKEHKAHIISNFSDIFEIMNWDVESAKSKVRKEIPKGLTANETAIVNILMKNDEEIDSLSWKTQIPLNKLSSELLSLEFKGLVKSLPGKKYKLVL